jgi:hypothetical protein
VTYFIGIHVAIRTLGRTGCGKLTGNEKIEAGQVSGPPNVVVPSADTCPNGGGGYTKGLKQLEPLDMSPTYP